MSTEAHTPVESDGQEIQLIIDELWGKYRKLQEIQEECQYKREKGRITDAKKEKARTAWICEERKTIKQQVDVLKAIAGYESAVKLDELSEPNS